MRFLVTGTAGFIGFHLAHRLLAENHVVHGIDGITPYYDPRLKQARHAILQDSAAFTPHVLMLEDKDALRAAADAAEAEVIVHLAAQAGVRYGLEAPAAYVDANIVGTFNLLEIAREQPPRHLILGSTSSVYGLDTPDPFREQVAADHPISLYAATKRSAELLSHTYSHLWNLPTTTVRFFTVYGPWGRPDMALFKFAAAITEGRAIDVYGNGKMSRDFTYIDDIVEGLVRLVDIVPGEEGEAIEGDSLSAVAPWRVVNIGNGAPVGLMDFIAALEKHLGRKAKVNMMPRQLGDVVHTSADASLLERLTGFRPRTPVDEGVKAFVEWYQNYSRA